MSIASTAIKAASDAASASLVLSEALITAENAARILKAATNAYMEAVRTATKTAAESYNNH